MPPYGLERTKDLAGVGIALVTWASAAFAGFESVRKLLEHGRTACVGAGIAGACSVGIVGNQVVARYKLVVAGGSTHPPGVNRAGPRAVSRVGSGNGADLRG